MHDGFEAAGHNRVRVLALGGPIGPGCGSNKKPPLAAGNRVMRANHGGFLFAKRTRPALRLGRATLACRTEPGTLNPELVSHDHPPPPPHCPGKPSARADGLVSLQGVHALDALSV